MAVEWTRWPFSIMGHVFDHWLLPPDPAEVAAFKRGLGFDAEHWLGSDFHAGGDDGRSYLFRTRHGFQRDDLAAYLPAAHEAGIKVLVYLNVHWFADAFDERMFARKADGSRMAAYGWGALTCPAGPFLDFSLALAEDLGEYEIDGVFLDGPYGSVCWCEHCRAAYEQKFGEPMPAAATSLAIQRRLQQWAAEKVATFCGRFREVLQAKRPQAVVYHNGSGLGQLTWTNRAAVEVEDLLGAEGGFLGYSPMTPQFLYKTTATGKLIEAVAGGKPTVIFCDHAFKKYDYWPLPRAELDLMYAGTLAAGANPWFLIFYQTRDTQAAEAARYWNRFITTFREATGRGEPAETAALLWSDSTSLVSASAKEEADSIHDEADAATRLAYRPAGDHAAAFQGAYALLARSGIPFRVVTERQLAEGVAGIDLLIAPSAAALEDAAFDAVERFVAAGGTLIADDEFAVLNERGELRDAARLAALLGATRGEPVKAAGPNLDYIAWRKSWLLAGIEAAALPRPERAFEVTRTGGKVLAFLHEPLAGRYDRMTPVSKRPAVLEHAVGGGRVFWLPMNLFEHYRSWTLEPHRRMVENLIRRVHRPVVEVAGLAGRGEVLVRRKPGRLIVHLLNFNGGPVRPFAAIAPLAGVTVTAAGVAATRARALHAQQLLPVRPTRAGSRVRLAKLGAAETIVFDLQ